MRDIEINLFGCMSVRFSDGSSKSLQLPPACAEMLGFLLMEAPKSPVRRERLGDCFWPDCLPEKQRGRLRTALWRLKKALPDWAKGIFKQTGNTVELYLPDGVGLAHRNFERAVPQFCAIPVDCMTDAEFQALDHHLRRYHGTLAEQISADWITPDRERFADMYCQGLEHQLTYLRTHGRDHESVRTGHRLLKVDPYREDVHAALIGSYARLGQHEKAQQQFRTCESLLAVDLGIKPALSGQALPGSQGAGPSQSELCHMVNRLQDSVERLTEQLDDIQRTLLQPQRTSSRERTPVLRS